MSDLKVSVVNDGQAPDHGPNNSTSSSLAPVTVQSIPKRTWRSYIWDTFDKSPQERRFLFKLDLALMTLGSLGYFIRYLDQVNLNNAFVSGMKEDLSLYGNELNYIQTCWTVGYVVGQIPSNLILTRVRPSIWLPSLEIVWSVFTMLLVTCKTTGHLCAVRFFIGLAESGFYPGFQYIVGSWYRSDELGKRASIFLAFGNIGSMVSGYIMAGAHKLDGVGGFYGWQWLFLICGIISLPIALLGYAIMPDMPETTRAWYLTTDEVKLAERRMELEGRAKRAPFTKAKVKKILTSWHIWSFALLYTLFNNGNAGQTQPGFALWLKSEGYSVEHVNVYPTVMDGLGVISTIIFAWVSDTVCRGERSPPIMASGVIKIIAYTGLTVWNISAPFKWACFMLCGVAGGISGLIFTWVQEICSDDNEERALVSASMNEITYVFQAWLPLVIWQQVESPRYPKGFPSMLGMGIVLIAVSGVIDVLHKREKKAKALLQEDDQVSSSEA